MTKFYALALCALMVSLALSACGGCYGQGGKGYGGGACRVLDIKL